MAWCEQNHGDYVFGLARNQRLRKIIGREMQQARMLHQSTGKAARLFTELQYRTHQSWSCERRVVAKAEYLDKGENPRFLVTSLLAEQWTAQTSRRSSTALAERWRTGSRSRCTCSPTGFLPMR
jgi:hypothetical protein